MPREVIDIAQLVSSQQDSVVPREVIDTAQLVSSQQDSVVPREVIDIAQLVSSQDSVMPRGDRHWPAGQQPGLSSAKR